MKPEDWNKFKKLNKAGLLSSILPGYVIKKLLTGSFFFFGVFIVLLALHLEGNLTLQEKHYLKCEGSAPCVNPYYVETCGPNSLGECWFPEQYAVSGNCPEGFDCERKYLNPGEAWGNPPSKAFRWGSFVLFFWTFMGLLVNHLFYNLNYDFKNRFKQKEEVRDFEDNNNRIN